MPIIVETGLGVAGANSYVTTAESDTYFNNTLTNEAWFYLPLDKKEAFLINASRWLDQQVRWNGTKYIPTSSMRWPRDNVCDRDDLPIANNVIPSQLKEAVFEVANYFTNPDNNPRTFSDRFGLEEITVDVITLRFKEDFNAQATKTMPGLNIMLRGLGYLQSSSGARFAPIVKT